MPRNPGVPPTLLALALLGSALGVPAIGWAATPARTIAPETLIAPAAPTAARTAPIAEPRQTAPPLAGHGWTGYLGNIEGSVRVAIDRAHQPDLPVAVLHAQPAAAPPSHGTANSESGDAVDAAIPGRLWMGPVVPNPSPGNATLGYELPRAAQVRVAVLDVAGRIVRDTQFHQAGGRHVMALDIPGNGSAPGVYFVIMDVDGHRVGTRRLVLRY